MHVFTSQHTIGEDSPSVPPVEGRFHSQRRCASLRAQKRELTAELRRQRRRHRAEERHWRTEELRTRLSDAEDAVT